MNGPEEPYELRFERSRWEKAKNFFAIVWMCLAVLGITDFSYQMVTGEDRGPIRFMIEGVKETIVEGRK